MEIGCGKLIETKRKIKKSETKMKFYLDEVESDHNVWERERERFLKTQQNCGERMTMSHLSCCY